MTLPYGLTIDPAGIAVDRVPLDLNTDAFTIGGTSSGTGIDWGQAEITAYESNEQRWGSGIIDFRVPNRTVTIPLLVDGDTDQNTFATAYEQLRQKVALLQAEGGWLRRETADGRLVYLDIVNASLIVPDLYAEAAAFEAGITLTLECLPDFYGDSISLDTATGTGEFTSVLQQDGAQAVIEGDYPGRAEILINDTSGQDQSDVLWGFRSRRYSAGAALAYSGSALTPKSGASLSGSTLSLNVGPTFTPIGRATFTHVGTYEVFARVATNSSGTQVRFDWGIGDISNPVTGPETLLTSTAAQIVNLGPIYIPPAAVGDPQWEGQLSFASPAIGTAHVWIDRIYLVPLDESAGHLQGITGAPAIRANKAMAARWDGVTRQLAGSVYGAVPLVLGDLPRIPPSGMEQRAVQLFVKPWGASAEAGNTFQVSVSYRPCFSFRP